MSDFRSRLEAHRDDVLVLLDEVRRTARLHEGSGLAGVVSHLAQAQALLMKELDGLPEVSKEEPASPKDPSADPDDTPAERIRLAKRKPPPGHSE
jgi:hypothetical protein